MWPVTGRSIRACYGLHAEDGEAGGEIESLFLAAEACGRGIGRILVADACRWFAARDLAPIVIWAFEGNPYLRFYEALGGNLVQRRYDTFPAGDLVPVISCFWRDGAALRVTAEGGRSGRID